VLRINRTYGRTGPFFEGRFRSSGMQTDGYLRACQGDIALNPVRAGMVQGPGDYPWSSYRRNASGAAEPSLAPHPVDCALDEGEQARRARYRDLFGEEIPDAELTAIRDATNGGFALGTDRFQRPIASLPAPPGDRQSPRPTPTSSSCPSSWKTVACPRFHPMQ